MFERETHLIPDKIAAHRHRVAKGLTSTLFRTEVDDKDGALEQAAEYQAAELGGNLVLISHLSKSDHLRAIGKALAREPFASRPIEIPLGKHQEKQWLTDFTNSVGIHLTPIVTEDAREYLIEKARAAGMSEEEILEKVPKLGEGVFTSLQNSRKTLMNHGTVILPQQPGRRPRLEVPQQPVLGTFLHHSRKDPDFGIFCIGIEIVGADTYDTDIVGGYNPGKRYVLHAGSFVTRDELFKKLPDMTIRENHFAADQWAYEKFVPLSPPEYW